MRCSAQEAGACLFSASHMRAAGRRGGRVHYLLWWLGTGQQAIGTRERRQESESQRERERERARERDKGREGSAAGNKASQRDREAETTKRTEKGTQKSGQRRRGQNHGSPAPRAWSGKAGTTARDILANERDNRIATRVREELIQDAAVRVVDIHLI